MPWRQGRQPEGSRSVASSPPSPSKPPRPELPPAVPEELALGSPPEAEGRWALDRSGARYLERSASDRASAGCTAQASSLQDRGCPVPAIWKPSHEFTLSPRHRAPLLAGRRGLPGHISGQVDVRGAQHPAGPRQADKAVAIGHCADGNALAADPEGPADPPDQPVDGDPDALRGLDYF